MTDENDAYAEATAEVERRVAAGRADGTYPPELDEQLASEFARAGKDPLWFASFAALPTAIDRVRSLRFGRSVVDHSSSLPGGSAVHRAVGAVVTRQVGALAQHMATLATEVAAALDAMTRALEETRDVVRGDLLGDIDAVHHRLIEVEHRLARLESADRSADASAAAAPSDTTA